MLVAPQLRECVCFVCGDFGGERKPVGTAFFFGITAAGSHPQSWTPFVITALHVIAEVQQKSDDGRIYVRVNTPIGSVAYVEIPPDSWMRPDQSQEIVDVAVRNLSRCLSPAGVRRLSSGPPVLVVWAG